MDYQTYINSWQWKEKAQCIKQARGNVCQNCGVNGNLMPLHVHHLSYERLGHEDALDLIVLCEYCHTVIHIDGELPGKYVPPKTYGNRMQPKCKDWRKRRNAAPAAAGEEG